MKRKKKIHEFIVQRILDNLKLIDLKVKKNEQLLITCYAFRRDGEDFQASEIVLTLRQMPWSANPVMDLAEKTKDRSLPS